MLSKTVVHWVGFFRPTKQAHFPALPHWLCLSRGLKRGEITFSSPRNAVAYEVLQVLKKRIANEFTISQLCVLVGLDWADLFYMETGKQTFYVLINLSMSPHGDVYSCCSTREPQEPTVKVSRVTLQQMVGQHLELHTRLCRTYIACIGERPGLLSLPLLFVCSIAPLSSSLIALAKLPRVGFPMEAVVYRGILFSAIEACQGHKQIHEEPWLMFSYVAQHARLFQNILHIYIICNYHFLKYCAFW